MPVPSPKPPVVSRPDEVRRLRDLLRVAITGGCFPDGRLPGDGELMVGFGAARSTVREALELLHAEGLLRPRSLSGGPRTCPPPARIEHRVIPRPRVRPVPGGAVHTRLLDRTGIAAPAPLADWLRVPAGAPCLRVEYVTDVDGAPSTIATHYVLQPEAEELLGLPLRDDWDTLLDDAGLARGHTDVEVDDLPADPSAAALLGVAAGTTLLAVQQTTADPDGRVFDVAVLRMRTGRR